MTDPIDDEIEEGAAEEEGDDLIESWPENDEE